MRIPVFGASIERGYWDFRGGWVHRLQEDLDRYRWQEDEDYSIYNLGISGDTSQDILERIKPEIKARHNKEDLAVILRITGVNDSQVDIETGKNLVAPDKYQNNIKEIINICKDFTEDIYLIGGVPIIEEKVDPMPWKPTHAYREEEIAKYSSRLEMVSEEKNVPLIEINPEIDVESWEEYMKDGVHPNRKGHKKIYEVTKRKLKKQGLLPSEL